MTGLGWKSVGTLEPTALPGIDRERWVSWVREADALLVNGGDTMYLCHWTRESGLADRLPSLHDTVYVGLSAGSLVLTPRIGEEFVDWRPPGGGDDALGLVDFSIFPHTDLLDRPERTMAAVERWAGERGPESGGAADRRGSGLPAGRGDRDRTEPRRPGLPGRPIPPG